MGADSHVSASGLPSLPSVASTLDDLARALHDLCGIAAEHIHRVPPDAAAPDVLAAVEEAVDQATGVVLFCYAGHGLLGPADELYLATHDSTSADRVAQAVPFRTVRDLLARATGGSVALLDCCFSGRAALPGNVMRRDPFVSARPDGSFLLASASYFAPSFAPEGEAHTLFWGRLLRVLEEGDPSGPPRLTLDSLHVRLDRMSAAGPARPYRQSAGDLGSLVVAPNRAYRPRSVTEAEPPADVPCPYPGMEPFQPQDSDWFFGREEETERLLSAVRDPLAETCPVILVGASGTGKSSLLRAGLLAGVERAQEARDSVAWPALLLTAPGPRPLRALADLWSRASGRDVPEVERELAGGTFPAPAAGRPVCRLLVIDQFEEIFTRCSDPAERARFIRALWGGTAPGRDGTRPRVVIAVRADHYGNCLAYPELRQALDTAGPLNLSPLGQRALRAVIERPAADAGLLLQDGLCDRVLDDLNRSADHVEPDDAHTPAAALPFLAHALRETWLRRSGAVLTLAGYQATGGIWQSVTTSSERLHEELGAVERDALRDLLLRMVHLTPGGDPVPRRIDLADMYAGRGGEDRERLARLCDRLTSLRLITVDADGARISHEALLRAWPRLRSWILDARAELIAYQRLAEAAAAWVEHGRAREYLLVGSRLAAVRPWLSEEPGAGIVLGASERDFLRACVSARRRGRIVRAVVTGGVLALALSLVAASTVAFTERQRSRERAAELASKRLAAQADVLGPEDPVAALDMSLAAYRMMPTVEARTSLLRAAMAPVHVTLSGHRGRINDLAYRKDGALLASSSRDGTVRLWHTRDPYRPRPGAILRPGSAAGLGWSPDGRYLTALTESALYVWDMSDPDRPRQVAREAADMGGFRYWGWSPDGRALAVPTTRGRVLLWDLRKPAEPAVTTLRVADERRTVYASVFQPHTSVLAVFTDDGVLRLWDLAERERPRPRGTLAVGGVYAAAFHPAGRALTVSGTGSSSAKGSLFTVDVSDPDHPTARFERDPDRPVYTDIAYAPDGEYLATSATDGRARVVSVPGSSGPMSPLVTGTALARTPELSRITYGPDGRGIASGDFGGGIHVWAPPARTVNGGLAGSGSASGGAFEGDQRYVATYGSDRGPATVWELGDRLVPRESAAFPAAWTLPRFLRGRDVLLTRHKERNAEKLWSLEDGRLRPGYEFRSVTKEPATSSDGNLMALQKGDRGPLTLWDIHDVRKPKRLGDVPVAKGAKVTPAFVRTGVLAVMRDDGTELWDVKDPRQPRRGQWVAGRPGALSQAPEALPVLLASPDKENNDPLAPERLVVWAVSANATAHELDNRVTGRRHQSGMLSDRFLANLSDSGQPTLWDMESPGRALALPGPRSRLDALRSHPETGRLAAWQTSATSAPVLAVWRLDGSDGETELVYQAQGLPDGISGLAVDAFSPRGDVLALASSADLVRGLGARTLLLDMDPARLADTLCAVRTKPVSGKVWRKAFPDLDYHDPCA
ncbi:caspase, EACC1-associated type [Streptomyces sp. CA-253872]|uniref:caspase, EACC1-associated type n=1 Tax=Streptomyces sp. CA-253872 TaxID=3240067 RepID=UPI003D8A44FD